jgi:glyoxylase-like metal-dependent hydrolase (beta-lactamase superfamily II)
MGRGSILSAVVGIGALAMATAPVTARQEPKVAKIEKVKDNLYVIIGGGGNTAAFITTNGVVVVDTKLVGWGQTILDQIKTVTPKPVTMIINTHTHGDHVGSNAEFPATVDVVAHENTKANMEKMPAFQSDSAKQFLPKKTYKDKLTLGAGNDRIDLYYFGRGHTNGDSFVVFPALRTVHTGDMFATKGAPFMDASNGGSGLEYPKTLAAAATGIHDVDVVIPGHSDVTNWAAFLEYGQFMQAFVGAVEGSAKAGKTADQTAASITLPDQFKDYNMKQAKADVDVIYAELGKK